MTEIELILTDYTKSEEELQEMANEITVNFSNGIVQLVGEGFNTVYMFESI